jgi:ubiquitin-protein ligase E3 A
MPSNSSLSKKSIDNLSPSSSLPQEPTNLNESKLNDMIDACEQTKNFSPIIRALGLVFSSKDYVIKSFQRQAKSSIDVILDRVQQPSAIKTMKKEDLRTLEDDEKEQDSMVDEEQERLSDPAYTPVDLDSLRRGMKRLYDKNPQIYEPLDNALQSLATMVQLDMRIMKEKEQVEEMLTVFVILFELFQIGTGQLEQSIIRTLPSLATLPVWAQVRLAHIWSRHCKDGLRAILLILQQIITLQVIANDYRGELHVNDNGIISNATKVMKIVFCANLLASDVLDPPRFLPEERSASPMPGVEEDEEDYSSIVYPFEPSKNTNTFVDPLMKALGICVDDCREPFIPFEEFHNEPLCENIEMDVDYLRYRNLMSNEKFSDGDSKKFTFLVYNFILTPATKSLALFFDSRIKMYSERRTSLLNMHYLGHSANPYLKLKIRRDSLIEDTLAELELVAMSNPKDLKKQIFIEFDGEQGIDEGGVSKEFFQLIVEEIFNPDYGMFITNEETGTNWFNSFSFENDAQFTLIGIVLGLAIYNNVILPVSFPMVVYRKLMNLKISWRDLRDCNPVIYNSLKSILEYNEPDMEETYAQTFEIGYQDVFGSPLKHSLKKDGEKIIVNQSNKHEFVELYADFLLSQSIEKQFKAFKKGFQMVTDESPLNLLFRPEEVELLVCGSTNFDFDELEKSTEYEGGYSADTDIIKHFWSIVHGLSLDLKRKLLQFTTGKDLLRKLK